MAEDTDTAPAGDEPEGDGAEHVAAAVRDPASLRQRMGRARIRSQVRAGFEAELKKRAKNSKKAGFTASEIPLFMEELKDSDIDAEADRLHAEGVEGATVEQADDGQAAAEGGQKRGPIRDFFGDNKELIAAIIAALLKKFLGV